MATNKQKKTIPHDPKRQVDPVKAAHDQAEKDIGQDPELSDSDPTDDLDEGELARKDNSDEEGFDALEKKRSAGGQPGHHTGHPGHHTPRGGGK